jgi:hypothetical protein
MSGAWTNMVLTIAIFRDELGVKCTDPLPDEEEPHEMWV